MIICRSNPIAPDPRVEKIAFALASFGYPLALLGWDRTGQLPTQSTIDEQGSPAAAGTETQVISIPVTRIPLIAPFGHGLGNLPNLLRWQWRLFVWLAHHRQEFDLVHACDFDTIFPALLCKWLWGKKVVYDIFDFYADHLRATPGWLKRIIRFIDLKAIGWSDALILADDSRWEQIRGAKPRRSAVIYNSPALTSLPPANVVSESSSGVSLRIAYVGLLQVERGLVEMLDVLKLHPGWRLDLAGFGGDEALLHAACEYLQNCQWHGRVPYDQALQLSQAADVLFATYDPAIPNHRYSSPNKVFEAMMLAKPIIVARDTNMDRIIEQADCGIVIEYGDRAALAAALERLQNDPELRQRLGADGLRAYQTTYSWNEMEKRLGKLYAEVAGGKAN